MYSTPSCHFCHMAKEFFTEHNVPFTEYDVLADMDKRKEMVDISGQLGVPVIIIDKDVTVGFNQGRVAQLLDIKE